jgi:hypothetical protein
LSVAGKFPWGGFTSQSLQHVRTHVSPDVKFPLFLSDLNQNLNVLRKMLVKFSNIKFHEVKPFSYCYMHEDVPSVFNKHAAGIKIKTK